MEEIRQGIVDRYTFHVSDKGWMTVTDDGQGELLHLNEKDTKEIVQWLSSVLKTPSVSVDSGQKSYKNFIDNVQSSLPDRDNLASRKASGRIPEADPFKVPRDVSDDGKQRIMEVETIDLAALARKNGIPLP